MAHLCTCKPWCQTVEKASVTPNPWLITSKSASTTRCSSCVKSHGLGTYAKTPISSTSAASRVSCFPVTTMTRRVWSAARISLLEPVEPLYLRIEHDEVEAALDRLRCDTLIASLLFPGYLASLDPGAVPLMVSATRSQ